MPRAALYFWCRFWCRESGLVRAPSRLCWDALRCGVVGDVGGGRASPKWPGKPRPTTAPDSSCPRVPVVESSPRECCCCCFTHGPVDVFLLLFFVLSMSRALHFGLLCVVCQCVCGVGEPWWLIVHTKRSKSKSKNCLFVKRRQDPFDLNHLVWTANRTYPSPVVVLLWPWVSLR